MATKSFEGGKKTIRNSQKEKEENKSDHLEKLEYFHHLHTLNDLFFPLQDREAGLTAKF